MNSISSADVCCEQDASTDNDKTIEKIAETNLAKPIKQPQINKNLHNLTEQAYADFKYILDYLLP